MYYIFSTLTCDNAYTLYRQTDPRQLGYIEKSILIKGGHGVAGKHLITPKGVMTEVTDADYEILKDNYHFQQHIANGFIVVEKKKLDTEEVAAKMEDRDASAPVIPSEYVNEEDADGRVRKVYKPKGKKPDQG